MLLRLLFCQIIHDRSGMMSDKKTFDETIALLLPHMSEVGSRRALVESGLYGCRVLGSIDWSGAPQVFTVSLVRTLLTFGECETGRPAIVMLLEELKGQVGFNLHFRIEVVIKNYLSKSTDSTAQIQGAQKTMFQLDPQQTSQAWAFLISVGGLAVSELKERWSLRRKSATATPAPSLPLPETEEAVPPEFHEIVTGKSKTQVAGVLEMVEQKLDLVQGWKQDRLYNLQEQRRGASEAITQARNKELQKQITTMMSEIERDLKGLGIEFEKQAG